MRDRPASTPSVAEPATADLTDLVERLVGGQRRALAGAITLLERLAPEAGPLLRLMQPYITGAPVIGITGPPGAGKSTIVNALIRSLRGRNNTVGVIAVDPSSPVSGGAILGDRVRMTAAADDEGVFVRSLASRGYLGGLSPAAVRVIDALDAAGKDRILLETVGTGQSEVDIAEIADVRIVVSAPGLGDGIQAMKAGLLEIADILVVNKSDLPGSERTAEELAASLSLTGGARSRTPIVRTSAASGSGISELLAAIDQSVARALESSPLARRRRRGRYLIARAAADLVTERIRSSRAAAVDALAEAVLDGTCSPADAASRLIGS